MRSTTKPFLHLFPSPHSKNLHTVMTQATTFLLLNSTFLKLSPLPVYRNHFRPTSKLKAKPNTRTRACQSSPPTETPEQDQTTLLLPSSIISKILSETVLAQDAEALLPIYTSAQHGFDNETFFELLIPLGGVPSLILGQTTTGTKFGGYAASGFLARDDYREAVNPRSMFVFTMTEDGQIMFADPTDLVQYDFFDYAIRLGAGLLGIPMNPRKHILKPDIGTSSCRLPNGQTSVFGDATLAKIQHLQVCVAQKYVDELTAEQKNKKKGFFQSLFG